MMPTHLTVIFGDANAYVHIGVGPQFRRVTIELTDEQKKSLTYQATNNEDIHHVMLETILPK